jgi:hypothetical protein
MNKNIPGLRISEGRTLVDIELSTEMALYSLGGIC